MWRLERVGVPFWGQRQLRLSSTGAATLRPAGSGEVQPWGAPNIRLKDPLLPSPALPAAGTVARQALAACTPSTLPWSHHHAHVPSCFIT